MVGGIARRVLNRGRQEERERGKEDDRISEHGRENGGDWRHDFGGEKGVCRKDRDEGTAEGVRVGKIGAV